MKYTFENQVGWSIYYTLGGGLNMGVLLISCVAAILSVFFYQHPAVGFLAGAYVMIIATLFVGATAAIRQQVKLLSDGTRHLLWTYEITKEKIVVSVQDKMKLTYERGGLKTSQVYKGGIMMRHQRGVFFLPFPNGRRQEIIDELGRLGWFTAGKSARRWRLFALLFVVWLVMVAAASVVVYFAYQ